MVPTLVQQALFNWRKAHRLNTHMEKKYCAAPWRGVRPRPSRLLVVVHAIVHVIEGLLARRSGVNDHVDDGVVIVAPRAHVTS